MRLYVKRMYGMLEANYPLYGYYSVLILITAFAWSLQWPISVGGKLLVVSMYAVMFMSFLSKSEFVIGLSSKVHVRVVGAIFMAVGAVTIKTVANDIVGRTFGVSPSLMPQATYVCSIYVLLALITTKFSFVTTVLFAQLPAILTASNNIQVHAAKGSALCIILISIISMNLDSSSEDSIPDAVFNTAYSGDFSSHHCTKIDKNFKVLYTGDSNNVIVMNDKKDLIGAVVCTYPDKLEMSKISTKMNP